MRKILEERLENARNDWLLDKRDYLRGQMVAYRDCLNLLPQPRTEQEILKDFEALGLVIAENDDFELILIDDCDRMIAIFKPLKKYECYYFSEGAKPFRLATDITMQEHKLLNELFEVWQWI